MIRPFDPRWRIKTDHLAALAVTLGPIFYFLPAIRNHLVLSPVVDGGDSQLFRAPYVGPASYAEYVGYVGLGTIALASLALVLRASVIGIIITRGQKVTD